MHWVQVIELPVEPADVLIKANAISVRMLKREIGRGWYQRFLGRHPDLVAQQAQDVSRARNEINVEAVSVLFQTLLKLAIEGSLVPERILMLMRRNFRRAVRVAAFLQQRVQKRLEQSSYVELPSFDSRVRKCQRLHCLPIDHPTRYASILKCLIANSKLLMLMYRKAS